MFMLVSFKILTINSDVLALVAPQSGATGRPSGNAATAKFAISFSNTDYIIIPVGGIDADDTKWGLTVNVLKDYKTAETCTFRTSDVIAPACYYLAIGKAN